MVHAYHVVFGAYGFWLPNDPRGSWSDFVGAWELRRFGPATKTLDREMSLSSEQHAKLAAAKKSLKYPPVLFSGHQAKSIAQGFANAVKQTEITIHACSILPEHVHLVIKRHRLKVEQLVRLLKGAATKQLTADGLHPLEQHAENGLIPSPWSIGRWKVYLESEEAIENAVHYVWDNPEKEGKPRQTWRFVQPFRGLDDGLVTYD